MLDGKLSLFALFPGRQAWERSLLGVGQAEEDHGWSWKDNVCFHWKEIVPDRNTMFFNHCCKG